PDQEPDHAIEVHLDHGSASLRDFCRQTRPRVPRDGDVVHDLALRLRCLVPARLVLPLPELLEDATLLERVRELPEEGLDLLLGDFPLRRRGGDLRVELTEDEAQVLELADGAAVAVSAGQLFGGGRADRVQQRECVLRLAHPLLRLAQTGRALALPVDAQAEDLLQSKLESTHTSRLIGPAGWSVTGAVRASPPARKARRGAASGRTGSARACGSIGRRAGRSPPGTRRRRSDPPSPDRPRADVAARRRRAAAPPR